MTFQEILIQILLPALLDTMYMVVVSTIFTVILGFIAAVGLIISGPKGDRKSVV